MNKETKPDITEQIIKEGLKEMKEKGISKDKQEKYTKAMRNLKNVFNRTFNENIKEL